MSVSWVVIIDLQTKQEGKVLQNLRRQCFLSVFLLCSREVTFPEGVNFSRGSQIFPRESTFPEGVNFSQVSQLFPWDSTFPKGVKFSRGSQPLPGESTFPEGVNFSQGSQFFPRKSTFPEGVNFSWGSQFFPRESTFPEGVNYSWGSQVDMCFIWYFKVLAETDNDDERVKCSPRPVGFAAGKKRFRKFNISNMTNLAYYTTAL